MIPMKRLSTLLAVLLISFITALANNDASANTISGKVTTAEGRPAAEVTVIIKGTNKATLTDTEGNFSFKNILNGTYIIEISFIGYETILQTVTVNNRQTTFLSFQLQLSQQQLAAVMVQATEKSLLQAG